MIYADEIEISTIRPHDGLGWSAVNIGAASMLLVAAGLTLWFARRVAKEVSARA